MSICYAPSGRTESYFQAGAVAVFVFGIFVSVLGFVLGSFVFPEYTVSLLQDRLSLWNLDSVGRQNFVRGASLLKPYVTCVGLISRFVIMSHPTQQPQCRQPLLQRYIRNEKIPTQPKITFNKLFLQEGGGAFRGIEDVKKYGNLEV